VRKLWFASAALIATVMVVTGCGTGGPQSAAGSSQSATGNPQSESSKWNAAPKMSIQTNKQYSALFHTNYGDFTVQLFAKDTPKTVNNFVFLAQHHFFAKNQFFRIMKTFMIQTGDPLNTGTGGPGYTIPDELPPKLPYAPGIVAMANTGQPDSGGSQFFICTGADSQSLNNSPTYTEFGKVVSGMSVIQTIASLPVVANPNMQGEASKPTKDAHINSVTIQEK